MLSLLKSRKIIQAPMAGVQGFELAAAVHNTGLGIGSIPCALLSGEQILHEVSEYRKLTNQPSSSSSPLLVNINFFCHKFADEGLTSKQMDKWRRTLDTYYKELPPSFKLPSPPPPRKPFSKEHLEALKEIRPLIVSFHFGLPAQEYVDAIKRDVGAFVVSSATTVEEALWLESHGVDAIIAQGFEAGGHRGMFLSTDLSTQVGTFALVPQIVARVKVPVIAAGGIVDAVGVNAAMALGATAAQVGTSFLLCPESRTSKVYRETLMKSPTPITALTNVFTGRPARAIMNRLMKDVGPMSIDAPAFPHAVDAVFPLRAWAESNGRNDFSSCWSGQNLSGCKPIPAKEILTGLLREGDRSSRL